MTNAPLFSTDLDDLDDTAEPTPDTVDVNEFIGEGKRFASNEILLKSKLESDATIKRREAELAAMRKELFSLQGVKDKLDQLLSAPRGTPPSDSHNNSAGNPPASEPNNSPTPNQNAGLTKEDVEKLLAQRELQTRQATNQSMVRQKLQELYGPNFVQTIQKRAKELGESLEYFEELAKNRPNTLFNLLGPVQAPSNAPTAQTAPSLFFTPSVSSSAPSAAGTERGKKFYDNLKKTDPKNYWSPKVQNDMHKDAIRLGAAFYTS